ncbi:TrbG/VirB9 family P-type conjugative transfer protein [Caulobacter rhizosphaerae]|jgi:type IV secretion system protein VirB9|uniref:TrbG/VirB9 family P-type conjugative transfer protein n=1 Tax=Caulobacter rhizosphaerae TaxID=2010972 RepID=UPI0013D776B3|nr:TrbG/VirB9 family P-type conjugative transfer protein [Caulobacter rhizosphaerae]GGL18478.1 P-type conjugative transfer protein VirB9 [Caulobacter rhizosphaerae]
MSSCRKTHRAWWAGLLLGVCQSAAVGGPAFAQALDAPDPRIKIVDYDPLRVVRVVGALRTATQIVLDQDEVIEQVALGDSDGWEVAAQANTLFIKPKAARAPTNLIVTAKAGAERRHYTFELTTRGAAAGRKAVDTVFGFRFRYPEQDRARLAQVLAAQAQALDQKLVQLRLERGVVEGPRNLAYVLQGSTTIAPSEVSDNGRFTVMRFPGARAVPAVYVVDEAGAEALVPFDVRGEFVVVHRVVPMLRLRLGREVLCIINEGVTAYGVDLGTGTASPQVQRTIKEATRP